jgi:membrane protease YdiL (CAAX protease family)
MPAPGPAAPAGRERPWWGPIDILITLAVIVGSVVAGLPVLLAVGLVEGVSLFDLDTVTLPPSMIVLPTLVQQAIWFGWPFLVSRWKGLGAASDWGWAFKPADIGIGVGVGFMGITAAGLVGAATSWLVGLEDQSQAENTGLLTDYQDSLWLWGIVFIAVIGAPVSEEILFRGLLLRAGAKRFGPVIGAAISLLFFVPVHLADGGITGDGQIVLWASIAALGAVLSAAAIITGRLAAPIIGHVVINAFGVAGALGYLDFLGA